MYIYIYIYIYIFGETFESTISCEKTYILKNFRRGATLNFKILKPRPQGTNSAIFEFLFFTTLDLPPPENL